MGKHSGLLGFVLGVGATLGGIALVKKTNALDVAKAEYDKLMKELNSLCEEEDFVDYKMGEAHHVPGFDVNSPFNATEVNAEMHKNFEKFVNEHSPFNKQVKKEEENKKEAEKPEEKVEENKEVGDKQPEEETEPTTAHPESDTEEDKDEA